MSVLVADPRETTADGLETAATSPDWATSSQAFEGRWTVVDTNATTKPYPPANIARGTVTIGSAADSIEFGEFPDGEPYKDSHPASVDKNGSTFRVKFALGQGSFLVTPHRKVDGKKVIHCNGKNVRPGAWTAEEEG